METWKETRDIIKKAVGIYESFFGVVRTNFSFVLSLLVFATTSLIHVHSHIERSLEKKSRISFIPGQLTLISIRAVYTLDLFKWPSCCRIKSCSLLLHTDLIVFNSLVTTIRPSSNCWLISSLLIYSLPWSLHFSIHIENHGRSCVIFSPISLFHPISEYGFLQWDYRCTQFTLLVNFILHLKLL